MGQGSRRRAATSLLLFITVVGALLAAALPVIAEASPHTQPPLAALQGEGPDDCMQPGSQCTAVRANPDEAEPGGTTTVTGFTEACVEPGSGALSLYAGHQSSGDGPEIPTPPESDRILGPLAVTGAPFEVEVTIPQDAPEGPAWFALACTDGEISATTSFTVGGGTAPPSATDAPRVEGVFDVVYTTEFTDEFRPDYLPPVGESETQTGVRFDPVCEAGPCDVNMSHVFAGLPGTGDPPFVLEGDVYRQVEYFDQPCTAHLESRVGEFRVTADQDHGGAAYATELAGTIEFYLPLYSSGEDGTECHVLDYDLVYRLSFVATVQELPVLPDAGAAGGQDGTGGEGQAAGEEAGEAADEQVAGAPGGVWPRAVGFDAGRSNVVAGIPMATQAPWDLGALALAGLLALALVVLIVFPSELFNSTLDEHYDEIKAGFYRRVPWLASRAASEQAAPIVVDDVETVDATGGAAPAVVDEPAAADGDAAVQAARRRGWLGFVAVTAGSALLYGLLDPGFGLNQASAVLLAGVAAGVTVATLLSVSTSGLLAKRRFGRSDYYLRVLPATLLVAAACVAISRLVGFLPGYLYGLVGGIAFRQALDDDDEARTVLVTSAVVLVAALAGWAAYGPVAARIEAGSTGFGWLAVEAILAGTFIAGVEGLLFGLIPVKFMAGHKLLAWSRTAWAATYAAVAFTFVHLIARPATADAATVSWAKTLALFVAFGAASIAFWAYWRQRDRREAPPPDRVGALPDGAPDGTVRVTEQA